MNTRSDFPLFTVIIPQKDRADYLIDTLRTCMSQNYPKFEIIVSDDCSEDNSVEVVRKLMKEDSRIKLFTHDHNLGMRDNFEFALNQVRPGYVIALGGDDGLTPGCIQRMYDILTLTNTELLTWPTPKFIFPGLYSDSGILTVTRKTGIKVIKSNDFLKKMSINLNYNSDDECPMFYIKGVVSTKLVHNVKRRSFENRFYSCPTPDGFSGIVLAGEVEKYSFTAEPLSIVGSNHSSQGVSYFRDDKKSIEESNKFFKQNENTTMHNELASQQYSPLISLMTADYLLTSRDLPGWKGKFPPINYKNLLKKSFDELASGKWSNNVSLENGINRELAILKEIAIKHNLVNYFNNLLKTKNIKKHPINELEGSGFTRNSYYFNNSTLDITNIYEAAFASKLLHNLIKSMSIKNLFNIIFKTIKYFFKFRAKGKTILSSNSVNKQANKKI